MTQTKTWQGEESLRELAEVATRAAYTNGFGFRGVGGPTIREGKAYVNLWWSDNTLVRAVFWVDPDEAPTPEGEGRAAHEGGGQ